MINRKNRWASAFTLIELMITVSIIGILASIAIPQFADMIRKAQEGQTKGGLGALRSAVSIYYADMEGQYPFDPNSLTVNGKYLLAIPTLRLPYYHPDTALSSYYPVVCGSLPCDPLTSSTVSGGGWGDRQPFWMLGFLPINAADFPIVDNSNLGNVWIDCSHTDSKGTLWTSY